MFTTRQKPKANCRSYSYMKLLVDQTVSTVSKALGYHTFNEFAIFPTFHTLSSNFEVRLHVCNIATIMYHLYRAKKTLLPTR